MTGYRGFTFSDLWEGNSQFEGWHKLSCMYGKPLFVGEIGWHAINDSVTTEYPYWFNSQWKDLVDHIDKVADTCHFISILTTSGMYWWSLL